MEGFTLGLALVDAIPVLSFGISMVIIASRFDSPLFLLGASLSVLAGCCKVAWKLVLGIAKKDIKWLNKPFVPMQASGFLLILVSLVLGFRRIRWSGLLSAVTGVPSVLFFVSWIGCMFTMSWYREHKFQRNDARSNWTAQIINAISSVAVFRAVSRTREKPYSEVSTKLFGRSSQGTTSPFFSARSRNSRVRREVEVLSRSKIPMMDLSRTAMSLPIERSIKNLRFSSVKFGE